MALTLGASRAVTGTNHSAISKPLGLVVTLTTIPANYARDPSDPVTYHQLGSISLGNSLGTSPPVPLLYTPQLVYPLADEYDLVAWRLAAGVSGTIQEIVRPSVANSALQPWDRATVVVVRGGPAGLNGAAALTTVWTYTVPAGKVMQVVSARVSLSRIVVATTMGTATSQIRVNALVICDCKTIQNVVGAKVEDAMNGGALVLPAGSVIDGTVQSTDVGGNLYGINTFQGFIFDV